jgi:hypothetical protein
VLRMLGLVRTVRIDPALFRAGSGWPDAVL